MDSFLIQAQREVDAMMPGTPPIAPSALIVRWPLTVNLGGIRMIWRENCQQYESDDLSLVMTAEEMSDRFAGGMARILESTA